MRLAPVALAAAVTLAGGGPGWAAGKCWAHAHKGAMPWEADGPGASMHPFMPTGGSGNPADTDSEVAGIDRDTHGQLWVYRVHEFAWRRQDVDLRGDCRRALQP